MSNAVLPDIELIAHDWLSGHVGLLAVITADRISDHVEAKATPWPYLTAQRVGGTPSVKRRLDRAFIDLSAYATTKAEASLIGRTARAAMLDMENYVHGTGMVTGVFDLVGTRWQPDASYTPAIPRYLISMAVTARPNP